MEDMGYADVTMACEDGQQGEARNTVVSDTYESEILYWCRGDQLAL